MVHITSYAQWHERKEIYLLPIFARSCRSYLGIYAVVMKGLPSGLTISRHFKRSRQTLSHSRLPRTSINMTFHAYRENVAGRGGARKGVSGNRDYYCRVTRTLKTAFLPIVDFVIKQLRNLSNVIPFRY